MRSLVVQVLWAPALVLGLLGSAAFIQDRNATHERRLRSAIQSERASLSGTVRLLINRHTRTGERVRRAVVDPDPQKRLAVLNHTSGHYLRRMRTLTDAMRTRIDSMASLEGSSNEPDPSEPIRTALDTLDTETGLLADVIDRLRIDSEKLGLDEAHEARIEFEDLSEQLSKELDRLDVSTRRFLRIRDQLRLNSHTIIPSWLWIVGVFLIAGSLLISGFRLKKLEAAKGSSKLERAIQRRQSEDSRRIEDLETELARSGRNRDVAEATLRRNERELARLRIYSENLINSLRSAVIVTDTNGVVTGYNRAARELLSPERHLDLHQHPIGESLRSETNDFDRALERVVTEQRELRATAVRYKTDPHQLLDVSIAAYLDERGAARGLLWVVDDVTENVETKNRLLAAERLAAVGRLSAQVAHEIRNPLSAIGLSAELLEDELGSEFQDASEARILLRAIATEIERLTEVTEGYLKLTRHSDPRAARTDVGDSLRDLLSMLDPEFRGQSVDVALDLREEPSIAWVDPGQLRQALLNVLRNAREAMPHGGLISISVKKEQSRIHIDIADEGEGIPTDLRHRIFEPFFTTKPDGTGLGLSLTQQMLRESQGDIELVRRDAPGTCFRIDLPATRSDISET